MARTNGAAAAARETRRFLEALLEDEPHVAEVLPPDFAERAEAYVALLLEANRRVNLTRITEPEDIAALHLMDAVDKVSLLDAFGVRAAVDLGSGGGIPHSARHRAARDRVDAGRRGRQEGRSTAHLRRGPRPGQRQCRRREG